MKYRGVASIFGVRDGNRRWVASPLMAQESPPPIPSLPSQMSAEVTEKWRALARQRHAHFMELHQSGRWKHYYSEHEFLLRLRESVQLLQTWEELAPTTPATDAADAKRASTA
jgi:hypothetical protein